METVVWIIHMMVAAILVGLVLLQHGKGADMGAAFGSGASGSLFGATGSANFLSRATAVLATAFFLTSMGLTFLSAKPRADQPAVGQSQPVAPQPAAPVSPPSVPGKAGDIPK